MTPTPYTLVFFMSGISIQLTTDDIGVQAKLHGMADRFSNLRQPLTDCGAQALRSTQLTFSAEGRPQPWASLAPATVKHKQKTGHTKMLVDSAILKNSITATVEGNTMIEGTTVPYARIQQLGGEIHRTAR